MGHGLLAAVLGRNAGQVRLGHVDRVAEDPVVRDLQGRDARALALLSLQCAEIAVALFALRPHAVELGIDSRPDVAGMRLPARRGRRAFNERAFQPLAQRRQVIGQRLDRRYPLHAGQRIAQAGQLSRTARG